MQFLLFNVMSRARTTKDLREMFIFNLCDAEQRKDEDYDDVVEENLLNEVPVLCWILCLRRWLFCELLLASSCVLLPVGVGLFSQDFWLICCDVNVWVWLRVTCAVVVCDEGCC